MYIPSIGKRVKLKSFSDYTERKLNPWAWFEVISVNPESKHVTLQLFDGLTPKDYFTTVFPTLIQPPIGWKEVYTIYVKPEKVDEVLSWLPRGIAVMASHDLSSAGQMAYQPADNWTQPHWQYPELTDLVPPEDTGKRIRIVKLESEYDASVMAPCEYCENGTRIAKEYHVNNQNIPDSPKEIGQHFQCFTCNGTGEKPKYLTSFDKKERAKIIKGLEKEGWKVGYRKGNCETRGYWMERETIVKEAASL